MTLAVQVSVARPGDAADIANMSRLLIEHGLPWSWREARVARAIVAPNMNVAVVREQGSLAGFGIMEYGDEDAHLVLFAVRPSHQRQGLGSTILRWLEATAVAGGARRIRLEARRDNEAARHFYNEHGYHEIDIKEGMYSGALAGIRLQKWLRTRDD